MALIGSFGTILTTEVSDGVIDIQPNPTLFPFPNLIPTNATTAIFRSRLDITATVTLGAAIVNPFTALYLNTSIFSPNVFTRIPASVTLLTPPLTGTIASGSAEGSVVVSQAFVPGDRFVIAFYVDGAQTVTGANLIGVVTNSIKWQ